MPLEDGGDSYAGVQGERAQVAIYLGKSDVSTLNFAAFVQFSVRHRSLTLKLHRRRIRLGPRSLFAPSINQALDGRYNGLPELEQSGPFGRRNKVDFQGWRLVS